MRWAPIDSLAFRASWGQGFRAPSLAQIGLGPSQESEFFTDTFGCADNPAYCANTDFLIIFSGNPDLQPEESENFNFGVVWQPTAATQRLASTTGTSSRTTRSTRCRAIFIYAQECANQASTVCVRGAPLPGDTLGPLQFINSGFVNIGKQSAQGIDLAAYFNIDVGGGNADLGLDYSHLLKFDKVVLDGTGLRSRPRSSRASTSTPRIVRP